MASPAYLSPSPTLQFHHRQNCFPRRLRRKPIFKDMATSDTSRFSQFPQLCTSFPYTCKLPIVHSAASLLSPPISDAADDIFTENSGKLATLLDTPHGFSSTLSKGANDKVIIQDPPWISSLVLKSLLFGSKKRSGVRMEFQEMESRKYYELKKRQIKCETEAWENMVEEYHELQREMCEKKMAPNLPYFKKLMLDWFEPFHEAIKREQNSQRSEKNKKAYSPYIDTLPADKMAVIVMHRLMGLLMMGGKEDRCVRVVEAAIQVGKAIEQEVRVHRFLEKTRKRQDGLGSESEAKERKEAAILRKRIENLIRRNRVIEVHRLVRSEDFEPWSKESQAKLGSFLIDLLTQIAYVHPPVCQSADSPPVPCPAFRHTLKVGSRDSGQTRVKRYGVIECDPVVLTGFEKNVKHILVPYIPMLVPPKKWKAYDKGGYFFLPSYLMRTHGSRRQRDALKTVSPRQMQKVFEALDTLGKTKWRVNKSILSVVENLWAAGGNVAGLVNCEDVPIPDLVSDDEIEIKKWKWNAWKVKKINGERHSQRCDTELKLSVARLMKNEEGFYYPHNVDFRGRAYPMHPHLNHLSSDLCRGILEFSEGRPLGKSGLYWLKLQLANLYGGGVQKLSYDHRLSFVENNMAEIFDSAENPLSGNRWWLNAEDPFQCLAACTDLSEALKSSSPQTFISHLPTHQDGSCNGLQHYAALGRDSFEAAAVNLVAGDKPADVYSEIAERVLSIMKKDSEKDPAVERNASLAKLLIDQVDRKLVKQTVMTSVYGVTYIGARDQIRRRLEEKGFINDERLLYRASSYAAKVTMAALGQLFQAAREIMAWLGDCAKLIASENEPVRWTTPLGLPVVQPYFKTKNYVIKTSLQVLALQRVCDAVEIRKQRTAFPPNFVHSLDGTHMMMTAVACRDAGLNFAGVHDSFWTHACDVDKMNQILRQKFVDLYEMPILENLLEDFQKTYPTLEFPPLPKRGDFDLKNVLDSPYFFN